MRYRWGLKKNIPHRERGDPPKFLVRHIELIGYRYMSSVMIFTEWVSLVNEITMGWHPCITGSELVLILEEIGRKYKIEMDP